MFKKFSSMLIVFVSIVLVLAVVSLSCSKQRTPMAPSTSTSVTATNTAAITPTNTPVIAVPTPTVTQTSTPAVRFNFATDQTGSWNLANASFSAKTYNTTAAADADGGAGCLQVTGTYAGGAVAGEIQNSMSATNFTGRTISCKINIPAALVSASNPYVVQIYVQDSTYAWDSGSQNIITAGWQTYSWVLPATLTQNITQIVQVGIQVSGGVGSPAGSGTILIDNINW